MIMMKKIVLIVSFALLLTACSSQVIQPKSYYLLPSLVEHHQQLNTLANKGVIFVQPIVMNDILNYDGIVYQTDDVKYVIASNHLWVTPLNRQLLNTLISQLSNKMPGWFISSLPLNDTKINYQIQIIVNQFSGRYDGKVNVQGVWLITRFDPSGKHKAQMYKKTFDLNLTQQEDGYDALVKTLAKAWDEQSSLLAEEIKKLN